MTLRVSLLGLLYGDYPELAKRFLGSIPSTEHIAEIRIGLNEVSERTARVFRDWLDSYVGAPVMYWQTVRNTGKYRIMREMMYGANPVSSKYVMWFDDDSYFGGIDDTWWQDAEYALSLRNVVQVGRVHRIRQRGEQYNYIRQQPWYRGLQVDSTTRFRFVTGGWWIADYGFLTSVDYPSQDLYHNGGDSLLGEIIRQQGKELYNWPGGAHCRCESCAMHGETRGARTVVVNEGGRKGRRGIGVTGEHYVGSSAVPPVFPESDIRFGGFKFKK